MTSRWDSCYIRELACPLRHVGLEVGHVGGVDATDDDSGEALLAHFLLYHGLQEVVLIDDMGRVTWLHQAEVGTCY